MTNVLVGGGTGLLGSAIVRRLINDGRNVFIPTRQTSKQKEGAVLRGESSQITYLDAGSDWHHEIAELEFEYIFHLAAENVAPVSFKDVDAIVDANITQGLKLAFIASNHTKKPPLIYAQTFWQFSEGGSNPVPNGTYSALKQGFHQIAGFYRNKMDVPTVGLVVFDTYSEDDRRKKLLPILAKLIADRKKGLNCVPLALTHGTQEVCFMHIDDVADAFLIAAKLASKTDLRELESTFFLSDRKPVSLRELVDGLLIEYGYIDNLVEWSAKPPRSEEVFVIANGPKLPCWKPRLSIRETFQKMVLGFENE